jgi:hypothetical protein
MKRALLAALVLAATTLSVWADISCRPDGLGGLKCKGDDGVNRVLRQADRLLDQRRHQKAERIFKAAAPGAGRHVEERRARERHQLEMEELRERLQQFRPELSR